MLSLYYHNDNFYFRRATWPNSSVGSFDTQLRYQHHSYATVASEEIKLFHAPILGERYEIAGAPHVRRWRALIIMSDDLNGEGQTAFLTNLRKKFLMKPLRSDLGFRRQVPR